MILLVDNYDSFTYNLYQYLRMLDDNVEVVRNDSIPFDKLDAGYYSHIVISPGPGDPTDEAYFGANRRLIEKYHTSIPILGVCLGHQGIGATFGAKIIKAPTIMHGKTSTFSHSGMGLFNGLPEELTVMRYHSLVIDPDTLPDQLIVDATAEDGSVMAIHHEAHKLYGVQFHPESFRTPEGMQILKNFLGAKA